MTKSLPHRIFSLEKIIADLKENPVPEDRIFAVGPMGENSYATTKGMKSLRETIDDLKRQMKTRTGEFQVVWLNGNNGYMVKPASKLVDYGKSIHIDWASGLSGNTVKPGSELDDKRHAGGNKLADIILDNDCFINCRFPLVQLHEWGASTAFPDNWSKSIFCGNDLQDDNKPRHIMLSLKFKPDSAEITSAELITNRIDGSQIRHEILSSEDTPDTSADAMDTVEP